MPPDILVFVRSPRSRARRIGSRILAASFLAGAFVTVATSGGILWERLSFGDPVVSAVSGAGMLLSAFLLLLLTERVRVLAFKCPLHGPRPSALFAADRIEGHPVYRLRVGFLVAAQLSGALVGFAAVWLTTRLGPLAASRWLSASPALLVNDVVAGASVLLLVWAFARDLDTKLLVFTLVIMTAYRVTERMWHVVGAPHPFVVTVQQAVVIQFVVVALALVQARLRSTI